MAPNERHRRLELERELDQIKAEVITLWHRVRRSKEELVTLQDEANDRVSHNALPPYRDELPSETQFSLRPTGIRVFLKNTKPSAFLVVVLVIGVVALVWLLRPR